MFDRSTKGKSKEHQQEKSLKPKPKSLLKRVLIDGVGKLISFNDDGVFHLDEDVEIKVELEIYLIDEKYKLFMKLEYPNGDKLTGIPTMRYSASGEKIISGMKYLGGKIFFDNKKKKDEINLIVKLGICDMEKNPNVDKKLLNTMSEKFF